MGPGDLSSQLAEMPKVDLHRHLEGSIRLSTIQELAASGSVPLPDDKAELKGILTIQARDPRTHDHFLSRFVSLRNVFQSEAIIRRIAAEAVSDLAQEMIRYAELHVTPIALAEAGNFDYGDVLRWVLEAVEESSSSTMKVAIVVSLNRHEPISEAERVLQAAVDHKSRGVVGVDLAGDEARYSADPFEDLFREAKDEDLRLSVHAGEWDGADSVRHAIEGLQADRIAHGIRVIEDKDVVILARERGVPFTVCLTSNVQSGVVDGYQAHPLPLMIQAGLKVCLNSDDPAVSMTDLNQEYAYAINNLGLGLDSIRGMVLTAAQAAFLDGKPRRELESALQKELGLAPGGEFRG